MLRKRFQPCFQFSFFSSSHIAHEFQVRQQLDHEPCSAIMMSLAVKWMMKNPSLEPTPCRAASERIVVVHTFISIISIDAVACRTCYTHHYLILYAISIMDTISMPGLSILYVCMAAALALPAVGGCWLQVM